MLTQIAIDDHSSRYVFPEGPVRRPYLEYVILYTEGDTGLKCLEVIARSYSEAIGASFLRAEAIKAVCIKHFQAIDGLPAIYAQVPASELVGG